MTARPGLTPSAVSAAARRATSARIVLERAVPSMSCAVMGVKAKRPLEAAFRGGVRSSLALRAECDLEEIGHGVGVELFHDVGPMRLDRLDRDAQVVGDLLVE